MTAIMQNLPFIDNKELYSSFNERRSRYSRKRKQSYLDTIKNHKTGFTIAGIATLLLGGAGLFIGKNKNYQAVFDGIQKNLKNLSGKSLNGTQKVKKIFYQVAMAFYNQNIYTNVWQLKLAEKCGWLGRMVIKLSQASIKGPFNVAKLNYANLSKNADKLSQNIAKFELKNLTPAEQKLVKELQQFMNEKKFATLVGKVKDGFPSRVDAMRKVIDRNDVNPHIDKYYPRAFTRAEIVRHFKENAKGFLNREILRENWGKTTKILFANIEKTSINKNRIGQAIKDLQAILKKINEIENPSKDLKNLKQRINSFIKDYDKAIKFEVNRYGGRELDLRAGGGLSEIAIPPVVGIILTHELTKKTDPNEKKASFMDRFVDKNGVAFVGGLIVWGVVSGIFGVNGTPAYLSGLLSGFALDKGFKEVYKRVRKDE